MSSSKVRLKALEKRIGATLTDEAYQAAMERQYARLSAVIESNAGEVLRFFGAGENDCKAGWDALSLWKRDQDLIDEYSRTRLGQPNGKGLVAWGRTPEEMWEHYCREVSRSMEADMVRKFGHEWDRGGGVGLTEWCRLRQYQEWEAEASMRETEVERANLQP